MQPGKGLVSDTQWSGLELQFKLTKRELEVCQRMFDGMTRQETASLMGIKTRTVRHYMERIHDKMRVSNRVQLVLRIIQFRDILIAKNKQSFSPEDASK